MAARRPAGRGTLSRGPETLLLEPIHHEVPELEEIALELRGDLDRQAMVSRPHSLDELKSLFDGSS